MHMEEVEYMEKNYSLANLVYEIGQLEDYYIRRKLKSLNLRMDHARILRYVYKNPGCNQKELASFLNYQPASLTNALKKLERRKLIYRFVDPKNLHKKQVFLSKNGQNIMAQITDSFQSLNALVGEVDKDTHDFLFKKLVELKTNFNKNQIF